MNCAVQVKSFHGVFQHPTTYIQAPLQVAAEREIARYYFRKVGALPRTWWLPR